MKKILFCTCSVFLLFFTLFPSCNMESENESGMPLSSEMVFRFENISLSSENDDYSYTINVDETNFLTGYLKFTARHIYGNSQTEDPGFEFFCSDCSLVYVTDNSCMLDYLEMSELGSYTVYAKSKINSSFDRYFVVNLVSNIKSIVVSYKIQSCYINDKLSYTEEMKQGLITKMTGNITLCAGAVYDFYISDTSEDSGASVKNINVNSTDSCVFFRQIDGSSGQLCCQLTDNRTSLVSFRVGKTDIVVPVSVNVRDISYSSIDNITADSVMPDNILSFVPNSADEKDKSYDYLININQVGDESSDLQFCMDYYIWDEEKFLNDEKYMPQKNPNPTWATNISMQYSYDSQLKYTMSANGILKTLSITPLNETVFYSDSYGTKNLHSYIYARYSSDREDTYRFKWRVMIGGELEGLDLFIHSTNDKDKAIENKMLEIHEGDEVSWLLRAKYRPSITSDHSTIWYISRSEDTVSVTLQNGNTVNLPLPAGNEKTLAKDDSNNDIQIPVGNGSAFNKTLIFFGGSSYAKKIGTDKDGEDVKVYNYYEDTVTSNGISDISVTYGANETECVLVCLNIDTGIFNTVRIKNYIKRNVVIKGFAQNDSKIKIPSTINTKDYAERTDRKGLITPYSDAVNQVYPYTVQNSYEQYRTFYMPVDSRLILELDTDFDIEALNMEGTVYANDSINVPEIIIDNSKRSATVILNTKYYDMSASEKENDREDNNRKKKACITDNAVFFATLNEKYKFQIKVIVYES